MNMRMKSLVTKAKKGLVLGLVVTMGLSTVLTGCGKKEEPEVVMTDDDIICRDKLIEAFDNLAAEENGVRLNMKNDYSLKMRTTMDGIQMDVIVDSNYTSTVAQKKGTGFGLSVENDYTINVESVSTSDNYNTTDTTKTSYVNVYDEPNRAYYYTLGDNDVTWYRTGWDGNQMATDFYNVIKNASVNYTMEETDKEYKISFDYSSLSSSSEMQQFHEDWREAMNAIDEYLDILGIAKSGIATFTITKDDMLIKNLSVTGISVGDTDAKEMIGNDSEEMVVGSMSITANVHIDFMDYGKVTDSDMDYYFSRITSNVIDTDTEENAEANPEQETASPNDEAMCEIIYEDASLKDINDIHSYPYEDLVNDDLNKVRFVEGKDYEVLYMKPSVLTNYGWQYITPQTEEEYRAPAMFEHAKYPSSMIVLLKEDAEQTYDDIISNGAIGMQINVLPAIQYGDEYPSDMEFTAFNIKFGDTEKTVLDKLGQPDVAYIGKFYTQYQYSTYSVSAIGELDTVSVVFTFYHIDGVDGLYDVDVERYVGKMQPNVGNKEVTEQTTEAESVEE